MSSPAPKSPYAGHRFTAEVISHAARLYFRLPPRLAPLATGLERAGPHVARCGAPLSGRGHQPCRLALLPLPARPAHGRGDAGRKGHHRKPRGRRDASAVTPNAPNDITIQLHDVTIRDTALQRI